MIGGCAEAGRSVDEIAAWVLHSCAEQGIAVKVTDTLVIAQVVALLDQAGSRPHASQRGRPRARRSSESPHRSDAVRVEMLSAAGAGANSSMVQHGANDSYSSAEVEVRPLVTKSISASETGECFGPSGS